MTVQFETDPDLESELSSLDEEIDKEATVARQAEIEAKVEQLMHYYRSFEERAFKAKALGNVELQNKIEARMGELIDQVQELQNQIIKPGTLVARHEDGHLEVASISGTDVREPKKAEAPERTVPLLTWQQYRDNVLSLHEKAEDLKKNAPSMNIDLIEAQVRYLSAFGRWIQESAGDDAANDQNLTKRARWTFGCLTAVCQKHLNPQGRYIPYLNHTWHPKNDATWGVIVEACRSVLLGMDKERERSEKTRANAKLNAKKAEVLTSQIVDLLNEKRVPEDGDRYSGWVQQIQPLLVEWTSLGGHQTANLPMLERIAEHPELLEGSELRTLRRRIHKMKDPDQVDTRKLPDDDGEEERRTEDLNDFEYEFQDLKTEFRGKNILVIGCDKNESLAKMKEFFGAKNVDGFHGFDGMPTELRLLIRSKLQYLRDRIKAGRYALVLYIGKYSSHSAFTLKSVCEEHGVPFANSMTGYGLLGVCTAIRDTLEAA